MASLKYIQGDPVTGRFKMSKHYGVFHFESLSVKADY